MHVHIMSYPVVYAHLKCTVDSQSMGLSQIKIFLIQDLNMLILYN